MAFRTCNISARSIFLFNIITVLVLVTYLFDLEKKIAYTKDISQHGSSRIQKINSTSFEKVYLNNALQEKFLLGALLPSSFSSQNFTIFYNRVPKTGSTSFVGLAYDLCSKNKFKVLHVNTSKNAHTMSLSDQLRFARNLSNWDFKQSSFYHGHVAYLDFAKFGSPSPLFINLIRQPLDRMVSYYYFLRYGDDFRPHLIRKKQGNKTSFDDCVKDGQAECDPNNLWLQVPFFCGHHADCWTPGSTWALEQAKNNLVKSYLLVGVTEQMEEFVAVLEATIPNLFKGALKLYRQGLKSHLRKTNVKLPLKAETIAYFRNSTVWQLENKFYEFALRQFEYVKSHTLKRDLSDKGQNFFYEKIRPR